MRIPIIRGGKKIAVVRIDDHLIEGWSKEDIKRLCKAILWEKWVHPMLSGDLFVNPWIDGSEKFKEILQKLKW